MTSFVILPGSDWIGDDARHFQDARYEPGQRSVSLPVGTVDVHRAARVKGGWRVIGWFTRNA